MEGASCWPHQGAGDRPGAGSPRGRLHHRTVPTSEHLPRPPHRAVRSSLPGDLTPWSTPRARVVTSPLPTRICSATVVPQLPVPPWVPSFGHDLPSRPDRPASLRFPPCLRGHSPGLGRGRGSCPDTVRSTRHGLDVRDRKAAVGAPPPGLRRGPREPGPERPLPRVRDCNSEGQGTGLTHLRTRTHSQQTSRKKCR